MDGPADLHPYACNLVRAHVRHSFLRRRRNSLNRGDRTHLSIHPGEGVYIRRFSKPSLARAPFFIKRFNLYEIPRVSQPSGSVSTSASSAEGIVRRISHSPELPRRNRSEERRVGKECRSRWSP